MNETFLSSVIAYNKFTLKDPYICMSDYAH